MATPTAPRVPALAQPGTRRRRFTGRLRLRLRPLLHPLWVLYPTLHPHRCHDAQLAEQRTQFEVLDPDSIPVPSLTPPPEVAAS